MPWIISGYKARQCSGKSKKTWMGRSWRSGKGKISSHMLFLALQVGLQLQLFKPGRTCSLQPEPLAAQRNKAGSPARQTGQHSAENSSLQVIGSQLCTSWRGTRHPSPEVTAENPPGGEILGCNLGHTSHIVKDLRMEVDAFAKGSFSL